VAPALVGHCRSYPGRLEGSGPIGSSDSRATASRPGPSRCRCRCGGGCSGCGGRTNLAIIVLQRPNDDPQAPNLAAAHLFSHLGSGRRRPEGHPLRLRPERHHAGLGRIGPERPAQRVGRASVRAEMRDGMAAILAISGGRHPSWHRDTCSCPTSGRQQAGLIPSALRRRPGLRRNAAKHGALRHRTGLARLGRANQDQVLPRRHPRTTP
jgi:hypothetical protein